MKNAELKEKDIASHLHSFTDLATHETDGPHVIERGDGIYLTDVDGNRYIDGMSSLWCCSLGYSENRLIEAAYDQMKQLPYSHTFRGRSHPNLIELSETLIELLPEKLSKVFFANSGSEANDTAIKLGWYYNNARGLPKKRKIIARHGSYHGTTIVTASLCGMPAMHTDFNLPIDGILFTDCPHYYHGAHDVEDEEQFSIRLAQNLEKMILAEDPDTIAAFIAEPVIGVGGVIVPPKAYFPEIQKVLRKYDILMIADEVICGFGRTGQMFGSITFDIEPDMMTCAKSLSSAYFPLSALMISDEIYKAMVDESRKLGVFSHGLTYSGHPVGAAVALEVLKIYKESDICSHVRKVGKTLQSGLKRLEQSPIVGEARGIGLMGGIELVANRNPKKSIHNEVNASEYLMIRAQELGLFVRASGDTIIIAPPLIITEDEMGELLTRLDQALEDTASEFA